MANPKLLYTATLVAALTSATGQQAIAAWWGPGWDWVKFGQQVFASGLVAVVLAAIARALQEEQDRQRLMNELAERDQNERARIVGYEALRLALSGWSKLQVEETGSTLSNAELDTLMAETSRWRQMSDQLDLLLESRAEPMQAFLMLDALHFEISSYLLEGARRRRLIYLQWLAEDLTSAAAAQLEWSPSVHRFRNATVVLMGWVQHTDTTILERLLVERATNLHSSSSSSNMWSDSRYVQALRDPAIQADPVYLLICQVKTACEEMSKSREFSDVPELVDLVARCLGALRNEIRAAADCSDALVAVAEQVLTSPSSQSS